MIEGLRQLLWPKGHRPDIWAIVDAAQDQQVYWTLTNSFLPHSCLFAGALPEALEMAAPYLVQLDPEDKFTAYLAKNLGRNVAVFLQSDASHHELRHHLRTFLTVKDTTGRRMLFRYYDPRVLRVYLPTCNSTELQTVFGPVTSYWTVAAEPGAVTQFEFRGKALKVTPQTLGGGAAEVTGDEMAPVIVAAQSAIAIPKSRSGHQRMPVLLQGAGKGGILRRSSAAVRFFRTVTATEELPFPGGAYTIPPSNLEPDITVYAEASNPAEVALTLELARGSKAEAKVQAVELTLETGSTEVCVGTSKGMRRRIEVRPVEPQPFTGRLTLRSAPGGPALTLFETADSGNGYALSEGYSFDAPREAASFWVEGAAISKTVGDAEILLSVEGSQIAGHSCAVTVVSVGPVTAVVPATPSRSKRLAEVTVAETATGQPLVLLAGAADGASAVKLRTQVKPEGAGVRWSVSRDAADCKEIRALSANPLPAIKEASEGVELLTDAAGTFFIRATAGAADGWGGPFTELETILIHAAVEENSTSVNGRFCACARTPGTDEFRLHAGTGGVKLEATVTLTGGGADGRRGVESIQGGWINNIVSDNDGARYKGGSPVQRKYRYDKNGSLETVDFDEGPLLDAPNGESRCLAGGSLAALPGEPISIAAQISPAASWKILNGGPIEQIWRYLECRSYLVLWSEHATGQLGVLLQTGWSFTGDYACNITKTTKTTVPARLASTGTTQFPALMPAARTDIEAHPPASRERGDA